MRVGSEKVKLSKMRMWLLDCLSGIFQEYSPSFGQRGRNTAYRAMLHRWGHRSRMVLLLLLLLQLLLRLT